MEPKPRRPQTAGAFLLLGFVAFGCGGGPVSPNAPVFLIVVDTLRADHLPAYGYRGVETPNLDALRGDAMLFANAYTHAPLTLVSHASLFTGLLPPRTHVRDNFGYNLPEALPTLAGLLKSHGYATYASVSSTVLAQSTGIARGFDAYDEPSEPERDGRETVSKLLEWLRPLAKDPNARPFAFLHLFEPHAPYTPPEPHKSRWKLPYDGEIARADELVGEFVAALRELGLYDRALVFFLSDHGEGLGNHGEAEHGVLLYREAIRVPLLVKLPKGSRAGETVTDPVALTDVFPTICQVVGQPRPGGLDGRSLLAPSPKGEAASRRIYSETLYPRLRLGWSDLASLVDSSHQFIEAPRPELYDLMRDPAQRHNIAGQTPPHPAFRALRVALARIPRDLAPPGSATDPERARRLASLGYLTTSSPAADNATLPDPKDRIGELADSANLGALLGQGRDAELIEACRRALSRNPPQIEIWRLLAEALERLGKHEEAIRALQDGLLAASKTAPLAALNQAVERLAVLLVKAGRGKDASRSLQAAGLVDPSGFTTPDGLLAAANGLLEAGRIEEAAPYLERAVALDPGHAGARLRLGLLRLEQGEAARAVSDLSEAVRLAPSSGAAWNALGRAQARQGDDVAAARAFRAAADLDPRDAEALFNLGIALGKSGDLAGAQRALEEFLAKAPRASYAAQKAEAKRLLRATR